MSATPRPWWIDKPHKRSTVQYIRADGPGGNKAAVAKIYTYRGMGQAEADAELIVRAANAHEELLEAADNLISILYSTETDLTGEQERVVEGLLYAATRAKGSA